jgi:putative ABC transport system substrate-binding protein
VNRREFISLVGGTAVWPLGARAQQPERVRRIAAFVAGAAPIMQAYAKAFRQGLEALGWIDQQNIRVDYRWTTADTERSQSDVTDVVASNPEAILAGGTQVTATLKEKTTTLPIVFVHVADPDTGGLVQNLARPGGNITGFAAYESSIGGKWLELLKEIAPGVTHVLVLVDTQNPTWRMHVPTIETAARSLHVRQTATNVRNAEEIAAAIEAFAGKPNVGMIVLPSLMLDNEHRQLIIELAAKHSFPYISGAPRYGREWRIDVLQFRLGRPLSAGGRIRRQDP